MGVTVILRSPAGSSTVWQKFQRAPRGLLMSDLRFASNWKPRPSEAPIRNKSRNAGLAVSYLVPSVQNGHCVVGGVNKLLDKLAIGLGRVSAATDRFGIDQRQYCAVDPVIRSPYGRIDIE